MRWLRAKGANWAAWLGVLALALNLLVPVHLAFDLAEALEPAQHEDAQPTNLSRRLIAFVAWHRERSGDEEADHHGGQHHHGAACPVCSALGSLAALAIPVAAMLALPVAASVAVAALPPDTRPVALFPAGYRFRAPPYA
jgi:hypothetical protein